MTTTKTVESTEPSNASVDIPKPASSASGERLASANTFVETVRGLANGPRAALRRAVGTSLSQARNCAWFYGLVRPHGYRDAETLFLIATLLADNRAARLPRIQGDFGKSLRQLANRGGEGGVERRLRTLLDADFDPGTGDGSLSHHLRQLIMRMLAGHIPVDWAQLQVDLLSWNHPNRYVQRNWAISYYGAGDEVRPTAAADMSAPASESTTDKSE